MTPRLRTFLPGATCFHIESEIEVGSPVEIAIEMPMEMLGTSQPAGSSVQDAGDGVVCRKFLNRSFPHLQVTLPWRVHRQDYGHFCRRYLFPYRVGD